MSKPRVIIFNSISLDGRLDNQVNMQLYYQLAGTWTAIEPLSGCAMLSGSETILAAFAGQEEQLFDPPANPKETIPGAVPYLVIVDSRGRIQNWKQIYNQPYWVETLALFSAQTPASSVQMARQAGIPIVTTGEDRVDLRDALNQLNVRFGIHTVRVDSGGSLNGALLEQGLVDEVSVLLNGVLAGPQALPAFSNPQALGTGFPVSLSLFHIEQVAENLLWLRYEVMTPL